MSLETLKTRLVHRIQDIENEHLIQKLFSVIESFGDEFPEPFELVHSDLVAIVKAEEDIADGKLIIDEEADLQVKKWL
jgi:hypothetical protein